MLSPMKFLLFLSTTLNICVSLALHAETQGSLASSSFLESFLETYKYFSANNVTSLSIEASNNKDSLIKFMSGASQTFLISLLAETGSFLIRNQRLSLLEFATSHNIYSEASQVRVNSVQILETFSFKAMNQWKLLFEETFETEPEGWTNSSISQCGGLHLLGGYGKFAGGETSKVFKGFPAHTMVRVLANFHFIDAWQGELAYLLADIGRNAKNEFLWSEKHDYSKFLKATDVCGNKYPENKLSETIDVVFVHNDENLRLTFGATLDQDSKENSWGLSFVQIFVK